jgi:hypothetical protein
MSECVSSVGRSIPLARVGAGWSIVDSIESVGPDATVGVVVDDLEELPVVTVRAPLYDVDGRERNDESLLITLPRGMVPPALPADDTTITGGASVDPESQKASGPRRRVATVR